MIEVVLLQFNAVFPIVNWVELVALAVPLSPHYVPRQGHRTLRSTDRTVEARLLPVGQPREEIARLATMYVGVNGISQRQRAAVPRMVPQRLENQRGYAVTQYSCRPPICGENDVLQLCSSKSIRD